MGIRDLGQSCSSHFLCCIENASGTGIRDPGQSCTSTLPMLSRERASNLFLSLKHKPFIMGCCRTATRRSNPVLWEALRREFTKSLNGSSKKHQSRLSKRGGRTDTGRRRESNDTGTTKKPVLLPHIARENRPSHRRRGGNTDVGTEVGRPWAEGRTELHVSRPAKVG